MLKRFYIFLLFAFAVTCTKKRGSAPLTTMPNTGGTTGQVIVNGCDSTNVSYSNKVVPILKQNCYPCHSTAVTAGGGQNLEDFNSFKTYLNYFYHADSIYGSKFIHVIKQTQGVLPMPPTGKLSLCDIAVINSWVKAGGPNN